jgi:hypothetical protein
MKLADFATDLAASNRFVKAAFGGFAGAGKSRTATEFVIGAYKDLEYTKPILIIDNEKGSRFLIPLFRNAGLKVVVKDTTSLDDVLTAFKLLRDGQADFLFIDSLTKVWYRYVREYKEKNRRTFMELMDWGKLLPAWQESFSDTFVSAQGSVVFTGRGGFSYEKEEDLKDEQGKVIKKGQFIKSGVKFKLASETSFEPDLNIWMEQQQEITPEKLRVWREAQVMKDRSGVIDGQVFEDPTYASFQPFVKFLIDAPEGPVAGQTSSKNLAPGENFDNYSRRTDKAIVLEELQEEIVKLHPSQSSGDKKAKGDLIEKLFGTRSWTAVENLSLERLQESRNQLWLQSRGHAYGTKPQTDVATERERNEDNDLHDLGSQRLDGGPRE